MNLGSDQLRLPAIFKFQTIQFGIPSTFLPNATMENPFHDLDVLQQFQDVMSDLLFVQLRKILLPIRVEIRKVRER